MGEPGPGYPWSWSIYAWLEGEIATLERIEDPCRFAADLARFRAALQRIDAASGPPPGRHNFYRGGDLTTYGGEARSAIAALRGTIDHAATTAVWKEALDATWPGPPVWLHGDVSASNLLVREGRLSAVIDFGCAAVGDPAGDLTIAWTLFDGDSRDAFRVAMPADDAAWARGRGWALWKGLITLAEHRDAAPEKAAEARRVIDAVLADRG